ncbi:MAG: FAD-dependent oxidoreductase [Reinekea sp.]
MKVAIVGAGLIGRLIALRLIPANHEITLLEANSFDNPTSAVALSAGLISPMSESVRIPPQVLELGFQSYRLWPEILRNLNELDPEHQPVTYQTDGTIAVSFQEEQTCLLEHKQKLQRALSDYPSNLQMLYNEEVAAVEPELERFETAIFLKVGRHTHADKLAQKLGSVRGEVIRVHTKNVKLTRPVLVIQQRFTIYIVPKPNNIFVVGATDIDKHGSQAVTVRSSLDLLSALYAIHPGFSGAEIMSVIAGERAFYENQIPAVTEYENILTLNGLNRHGWLAGPALVESLIQKIS